MLFTHFCKHISPIFIHLIGFPPWITDKKIYILEVMQTPATTAGSEQSCEISENDISSEISQNPLLRIPDKHHTAWSFEWKVIRCRACHGSQRWTTSTCNRCLLQRESLLTYFGGVCPLVASPMKAIGMPEPPNSEAVSKRIVTEMEAHFWGCDFSFFPSCWAPRHGSYRPNSYPGCMFWTSNVLEFEHQRTLEWNLDEAPFADQRPVDLEGWRMTSGFLQTPWTCLI